uniref:FAS1 domain-containing protein n=1 Tax=Pelagomonas calceolata TaxID=35677 RepID=A0A7S4A5P0_9STRA|mmetsp:Transcript_18122/g.51659  ORF Transcript_18122/g.51659 Transcript_18122/m.51659 type:complete len:192 (+) Transcript_18122:153-728(+)
MRALLLAAFTSALQPPRLTQRPQRPATRLYNTAEVEACLNDEFPSFAALVFQNEELWRGLRDGSGYTVLAPNEAAFNKLEDKRRSQLKDPRNGEVVEQIGAYHVISDPVSKDDLYESSGVVTAGGRIDVGRSVVGGFMGIGGKEDGGVTVNGAKIVSSKSIGECIIHEMDDFAHPKVLDRYFDQLRIPGSS